MLGGACEVLSGEEEDGVDRCNCECDSSRPGWALDAVAAENWSRTSVGSQRQFRGDFACRRLRHITIEIIKVRI